MKNKDAYPEQLPQQNRRFLMTSMLQRESEQADVVLAMLNRRKIVAHIGCAHNHHTFAWASQQAMVLTSRTGTTVFSLCADLPALHQEALCLADEILVLNLTGYLDPRTLYELCVAHNLGKPISWLEEWPMDCPRCGCTGPEAEHFFHAALSLHDLNEQLAALTGEHLVYVSEQRLIIDWYGQLAPLVLLPNGLPALQVDLACPLCEHFAMTAYAVAGAYGAWVTLLGANGEILVDLCDADQRNLVLVCSECADLQEGLVSALMVNG